MNGSVSDYVVAMDLGSSKIVGCLGKKEMDGKIRILSLEQKPVRTEIRRGVIHNIEEVAKSVQDVAQLLSDQHETPCKIEQVYVGLNGYTIRTVDASSVLLLSGEELVRESHLDELADDAQSQVPDNMDVVELFTQEFMVDGKQDINPVGAMPQRVEGHYKMVGGKSTILRNLDACFDRIHLNKEFLLGPLASAEAVLRPEDKSKGVVVVDFGAETTSICVYKNNLVRYVSVLPFGGNHVTRDLLQLNIDEEEAEQLKCTKGSALHYTEQNGDEEPESDFEKLSDFDKEANEIMVARSEEIVENIWTQIRYSGIDPQKLIEGLVITGGASVMSGLMELLQKKTGLPVRMGKVGLHLAHEQAKDFGKPEWALCVGLLLLGKEGGCSPVEVINEKVFKPGKVQEQTLGGDFEQVEVKMEKQQPKAPRETKKQKENKSNIIGKMIKSLFDEDDL